MGLEHVVQFGYLRLHFFNGVIGGSGSLQVLFFFLEAGSYKPHILSRLPGHYFSHLPSAPGADDWRLHWWGV